jgi:geranylgeranylglyceryl phosphate synthase family protein
MQIYTSIINSKAKGLKQLAVLIDPDKVDGNHLPELINRCVDSNVDYIFVGGSLLTKGNLHSTIEAIKSLCSIPVLIFPGSHQQIEPNADALLLLSLISGRNPELLIGQHVIAAPFIKKSGLEVLPTGYLLIESGTQTTVQYISNTTPLPSNKPEISACTALAGELLGMKLIFAEAGSGALNAVPEKIIKAIRDVISVPLIVGGGIRTAEQARKSCDAGADIIVVGNILEKEPELVNEIAEAIHLSSKITK